LIREQFNALEDFGNSAKGANIRLSLGGSGTILQWLVAPRLNPASLPSISFHLLHESEADMIEHLQDGRLDLAIISKQPLGRQFASSPLGVLDFALYVPKSFKKVKNLKEALRQYPLALPVGGRVRESILAHSGCILNTSLGTSGYSAALSAVRSGSYAAVLPLIAASELEKDVQKITVPESVVPKRPVIMAWKRRAASTRPVLQSAIAELRQLLQWN
jgi:DNA-binding transcriptional LysR family regulator